MGKIDEKKLYLIKKVSQKEGKEPFPYVQLVADLGYQKVVVSMDKTVVSELLDCSVSALFDIVQDTYVPVAYLKCNSEVFKYESKN